MRFVASLLLPALLLGGCSVLVPRTTPPPYAGSGVAQGGYTPPQPSGESVSQPSYGGAAQSGLVGQWRVSTIDGKALELPEGVTVTVNPSTIHVGSGCIQMAWKYTDTGGVLATSPSPVVSCRRGYFPQETLISQVLSDRVQVSYPGQGSIELSANGHRLVLFRQ